MRPRELFWVRFWLLVFIAGLLVSGVTALPLVPELNLVYRALHHFGVFSGPLHDWIQLVYASLLDTKGRYPFLFYGTDWLAFGHFVIAFAFVGPVIDPRRNIWVIKFGIMASAMVTPYALVFGFLRGIPWWWRLIDCSFGIFGLAVLLLALRLIKRWEVT